MNNEIRMKKRQMLESLDYIDDDIISGVLRKIKPDTAVATYPVRTWKTPFKYWKQFTALAACMLLLAFSAPIFSYFSKVIGNWGAAGVGTSESSEMLNSNLTDPIETEQSFTTESIKTEQPIDTTAEHTQLPFQYVVSREEFDEMTAAWKIYRNRENAYITKTYEEFSYYYPCQYIACVYKKEADVVVFCKHSAACWYGEMTIAGYLFKLPSMEEIWVYKNNEFYSLGQAYELEILDEEDIKELSEIHHEHLYGENRFG